MVDEAQKALEEAEALKKVVFTLCISILIYYVCTSQLNRFVLNKMSHTEYE
jgi:hypothetical protein